MSDSSADPEPPRPAAGGGFPPGVAFIDGRFVPIAEARLPVLDWGFLRSDATYDVVHVWQGRFFRLDRHLDRFLASVGKLRLALPFGRERLAAILAGCVRRAGLEDAYVEMICTRGHSPSFSRDPREAVNRFIAFAIPFGWIATEAQRARGLRVAVATVARIPPQSVDPTVKNYHWLDLIAGLLLGQARRPGLDHRRRRPPGALRHGAARLVSARPGCSSCREPDRFPLEAPWPRPSTTISP